MKRLVCLIWTVLMMFPSSIFSQVSTLLVNQGNYPVIFDQAQFVTDPGAIYGYDASNLQEGQSTYGPNINYASNYLFGDDFTLSETTIIGGFEVYAYQTGSTTTSTLTGLYAQIYMDNPVDGGQPIWGDTVTNLLTATAWTQSYRTSDLYGQSRPIMSATASNLTIELPAGKYWLVFSLTGSISSGPWGMPVTIPGQITTGDAVQRSSGGWRYVADTGSGTQYGAAMQIYSGEAPDPEPLYRINAEGDKVIFAKGNLQYQASTSTWRFAEHQYDFIGADNAAISSSNAQWIDLFGWGTSGYHQEGDANNVCYQPWSVAMEFVNDKNYYGYGPSTDMLSPNLDGTSAHYDWGIHCTISNDETSESEWFTPTGGRDGEWYYIFNTRQTAAGFRFAKAQVNGVNGVILVPDSWLSSRYPLNAKDDYHAPYSSNVINSTDWNQSLEANGCVFLPAAGYREGTEIDSVGTTGYYWSSTCYSNTDSRGVWFFDESMFPGNAGSRRYYGASVRLVRYSTLGVGLNVMTNVDYDLSPGEAVLGGTVVTEGESPATQRGICWSKEENPTLEDNVTIEGEGLGSFSSTITNLEPGTTYYFRAYAVDRFGVVYGIQRSFTTQAVITSPVIGVTTTTAMCGGTILFSDMTAVTACGVCWSQDPEPTVSDDYTSEGTDGGNFTSELTGLELSTTYYVRAYVTCGQQTFYGESIRFITKTKEGAISGKFTINADGGKVLFSQGNLQYNASTDTWRFAEHQYGLIGMNNANISSTYNGWIDLFGWGTSGYQDALDPYVLNYQPWSSSTGIVDATYNEYGYGPSLTMSSQNLTGSSAQCDWGVSNAISNGGNAVNQWRTLTSNEWYYLLYTRQVNSGPGIKQATVNGIHGMILLPDDWSNDIMELLSNPSLGYQANVFDLATWNGIMEANGCVFLPAAGCRDGGSIIGVTTKGYYWSSTHFDAGNSNAFTFTANNMSVGEALRYKGQSVRLVCPESAE